MLRSTAPSKGGKGADPAISVCEGAGSADRQVQPRTEVCRCCVLDVQDAARDVAARTSAAPGSAQGLHLIVPDIDEARAELTGRGTDVREIFHFEAGGQTPGPDPERSDYNSFFTFNDPDGNGWLVQEVTARAAASA